MRWGGGERRRCAPAVLPWAQAVALVEQAVEVAGVLVAHLCNDLLNVQIAAAQQPRGGLHAVLLQQLLVGAPGLSAHALADIRQRNTISPCHIGKAGLTIILGDLLQRRLHQCIAAHGLHAGLLRGAFKLCHHCICPP